MTTMTTDADLAIDWRDWSCDVHVVVHEAGESTARAAALAVEEVMADVARSADRFDPDSELSLINRASGRLVPVSPTTIALLDEASSVAAMTGGAVVPTLGRQLRAAGYTHDIDIVRERLARPTGEAVPARPADVITIDRGLNCVSIPHDVELDLGAVAKAWAVDKATKRAAEATGKDVLVSIGGDLACAGPKSWLVSVKEVSTDTDESRVMLDHGALATSTTMGRRWRTEDLNSDGWAHHLIDPRTGSPVTGPWRTATVWAPNAVRANALSTAALVWGDEAVDRLAMMGAPARLVHRDGRIVRVGDWPTEVFA